MDKYEFNIKVEQIKKLVNKNDFATAMKIADTIDWRRVRNANLLSMISQVYEKNKEYQEAKEVLLLAFERAPIGKRLLFKLTELALREGSVREAEDYYREFCDLAPEDPRQHLLRYMILKMNGAPIDQLIHTLERYTATELEEKWMYELAELYDRASRSAECVQLCDKMILMFGVGTYVERAMNLKQRYAPLNKYQRNLAENRDVYEERLRAVENEYENRIGNIQGFGQPESGQMPNTPNYTGNYGGSMGYDAGSQGYDAKADYSMAAGGYVPGGGYVGENQNYAGGAGGYVPGGGYAGENRNYAGNAGGYMPGAGYAGENQNYGGAGGGYMPEAGYTSAAQGYGVEEGYGTGNQGYMPENDYGVEAQEYTANGGYNAGDQSYMPGSGYGAGAQSYQAEPGYSGENQGYVPGAGYGGRNQGYDPEAGYYAGSQGYSPEASYGTGNQGNMPGDGYGVGVQGRGVFTQGGNRGPWPAGSYVPGAGAYSHPFNDYTAQNQEYGLPEEEQVPNAMYESQQDSFYMEENGAYGSAADGSYMASEEGYLPEMEVTEDPYEMPENQGAHRASIQRIPRTWNGPASIPGMEDVDEELVANLHQAAAEKELAAEMSKISTEDYRETDSRFGMTKIFNEKGGSRPGNISRLKPKSDMEEEKIYRERYYTPHHLMIEASTAESGFEAAVEVLKKIHQKTGVNNQVIKITGSKLSKKGVFNVSDKLAGKDLIIEEAGDLSQEDLEELQMLLERDETGMVAVLIDNPYQIDELHQQNPGFVNLFQCLNADEAPGETEWLEEDQEEDMVSEPEEEEAAEEPEPEPDTEEEEEQEEFTSEEVREEEDFQDETLETETEDQPEKEEDNKEPEEPEDEEIPPEDEEPQYDDEYADDEDDEYEDDEYEDDEYDEDQYDEEQEDEYDENYEESEPVDDEELDLNDFADYAVNYAKEIDCSITGKSMLALYERIEIMEEDGIPLTRTNAEDLIEEAADKAEKPSLGGLIKGVFSSKYDKEGLLILKEEHFI